MPEYKLSHLKELEAEAIYIIREVAAEFQNPVMLYSIGKDSSVMVRLAEKAFAPGKVPFPLMHIDSKWKFKEMIAFRDQYAREHNWNLIVESNMEAFRAGVGPFTHGSKVHTDLMKTQALWPHWTSTNSMPHSEGPGVTKRNRVPRNASSLSGTGSTNGIPKTSAPNCGTSTTPESIKANPSGSSLSPTGRNWMYGNTSGWKTSPSSRSILPKSDPS